MSGKIIWYFLLFMVISVFALRIIPQIDKAVFPNSTAPGAITFFGVGIVFTALTALIFYNFAKESNLPKQFLIASLMYSVLIIITKFMLGAYAYYFANRLEPFIKDTALTSPFRIIIAAVGVFLLYFGVFFFLYLFYKRRVSEKPNAKAKSLKERLLALFGITLLAGLFFLPGAIIALLLLLFPFGFTLAYLTIIFSTMIGICMSLAIVAAIMFARLAFKEAGEYARTTRNVAILVSFFWVGVALLLLYHALWVVYMIALVSLWPLKVVSPSFK
jgi:hypothetical protein